MNIKFKKEKKPIIEFISEYPELMEIEECLPKPAKNFIPQWWKDIPSAKHLLASTVKECPGFPDYFSQGYVIPMWADSYLSYDKQTDNWSINSSKVVGNWEVHHQNQFLDHTVASIYGNKANVVFKTNCPWSIRTPLGYSVFQMPLFYNFNENYSILPGVIDTDIHHDVNQQVLHHSEKKEIFIKRGDPFALYIPFKRTKYDLVVRAATEKDIKYFRQKIFNYATKSMGQGEYRALQRKRDKEKFNK